MRYFCLFALAFFRNLNVLVGQQEICNVGGDDVFLFDKEQTCSRVLDGRTSEPTNLSEFIGAFQQLGTSWKGVLDSYVDIIKSAEGKQMDSDVFTNDLNKGLDIIRGLVQKKVDAAQSAGEASSIWYFRNVPCIEFNRTLDDVFIAFLNWASVAPNQFEECGLKGGVNKRGPINVSKAFRRLESYAQWMDSTGDDLADLTAESVKKTCDLMYFRVTHDDCGRVVWWLDLGQTDFVGLKGLRDEAILRLFVWLAHLIMFEQKAQENGVVFFESMSYVGFWQYMTMLPVQVGLMLDKYMVGVIPVRTKLVVFLKRPFWVEVMYGMLKFFLPKRMKRRVEMPSGAGQKAVEETVGMKYIPVGFDDLEGSIEVDLIAEKMMDVGIDVSKSPERKED